MNSSGVIQFTSSQPNFFLTRFLVNPFIDNRQQLKVKAEPDYAGIHLHTHPAKPEITVRNGRVRGLMENKKFLPEPHRDSVHANPNVHRRLFTGGTQMNSIIVNTSHHQEQFSLTAGGEAVTALRHHCQKNHQMRNPHVPGIPPGCWADTIYTVIFDSSITQLLQSNCVPLE